MTAGSSPTSIRARATKQLLIDYMLWSWIRRFNAFCMHDVDLIPDDVLARSYAQPPLQPIHIAKVRRSPISILISIPISICICTSPDP